jgi:hypothetical protein
VAAIGPDLTGRVHHAVRRATDRRWWRRRYPGWDIPKWDYVSLCGRRGLIAAEQWRRVDCRVCGRVLAARRHTLAQRVGAD